MAALNKSHVQSVSYDTIRTNNEEDTQQLSFRSSTIHSIDELRSEMHKIGTNISTNKTNWQSRVQSIQHIGNMISGGILNKYPQEFIDLLFNFRDGVCVQITELRSGVTKEIYRVLSHLAISIDENKRNPLFLKQQIQAFIDYIIPYILKQTKQTILIISHGSNITMRSIIKRVPIGKCIQHIIANTNINHQKSICSRVRCIEYIQIIIETQLYHQHYLRHNSDHEILSKITEAIIDCISDPHPTVRYVARHCVWSLNKIYPNAKYTSYILNKISSQNAKYVISEKVHYQWLPPPIGKGHKVELGAANKGLMIEQTNKSKASALLRVAVKTNRPKSALPSRTHRLELLKKKKKEMANKFRKKQDNHDIIVFPKRPQTAHIPSSSSTSISTNHMEIGRPLRISMNNNDNDGDITMKAAQQNVKTRKISILGNATRFSMNNSPKTQSISHAIRIEKESHIADHASIHYNDICNVIMRIDEGKVDGIRDLIKYEISNKNISVITESLNGFMDGLTMNKGVKGDANDLFIEALVKCINHLIVSTSHIAMKDLLCLLSKLLRLYIKPNCNEYKRKYNEYCAHFESIAASLHSHGYSFKSLVYNLSQSMIQPKQKIIWFHFLSLLCKQEEECNQEWNLKLFYYLFALLKECIMNPQFMELHTLFRCSQCMIMDDVLLYLMRYHVDEYHEIFKSELNDVMIETLLGTIKNECVIHLLQKYYKNTHNDRGFTTPSHQNKRYQMIQKRQIESMTTPPLNMYMTTPAPINQKENNKTLHDLNNLNDAQLCDIILNKNTNYIKSVLDEKNALKYLSHRINGNKAIFAEKCQAILRHVVDIMNSQQFVVHRNALRILQAICWFYPKSINQNIEKTLMGIINLFRKSAPEESGELALDVITQFCKIIDYKLCIHYLLPIIQTETETKEEQGRKIFAALSIFDRIIVTAPIEWIKLNINEFTKILIAAYKYHREPMRSLIYLCIICDGDTSFLKNNEKVQKIVKMMSKETDFTDWVKSHRMLQHKQ